MQRTWLRCLCDHRDECIGTACGKSWGEGEIWYVFVFALRSPLEVWFVKAVFEDMAFPFYDGLTPEERTGISEWWSPYQQRIMPNSCCNDMATPWAADDDIQAVEGLWHEGVDHLTSKGPCQVIGDCLVKFPILAVLTKQLFGFMRRQWTHREFHGNDQQANYRLKDFG